MAMQLIEDFEKIEANNMFLFLKIDTLTRRAELSKHVDHLDYAIEDFTKVVELCK
jgi:hypothetical protein